MYGKTPLELARDVEKITQTYPGYTPIIVEIPISIYYKAARYIVPPDITVSEFVRMVTLSEKVLKGRRVTPVIVQKQNGVWERFVPMKHQKFPFLLDRYKHESGYLIIEMFIEKF